MTVFQSPLDPFGLPEPIPDEFNLSLWGTDSLFRLLLKRVENVQAAFQSHGVDGSVCVTLMVFHHLEYSGPFEPSERFRIWVFPTPLRDFKGVSDHLSDRTGKAAKDPLRRSYPYDGLQLHS